MNQANWHYAETAIWELEKGGEISMFHVFGVVALPSNAVLAFCEARPGTAGDETPHHLWMKKSVDGGLSFGENRCLVYSGNGECFTNPTPLYDPKTGRLHLFYAHNFANRSTDVYYLYSDDEGESWSETKCMNECFDSSLNRFHLPGPGHGIRVEHGAYEGRLIVPFWHRAQGVEAPMFERGYCTSMLISDDYGKTWKNSDYFGMEWYANETRICETMDEKGEWLLLLQGRKVGDPCRYQTRSYDGGFTWEKGMPAPFNAANNCDAGLLHLKNDEKMKNAVLVSRPTSLKGRKDHEIQISLDGGVSYCMRFQLPQGDCMPGYSDLCLLPDGTVGLLYPREDHILFARISLETLTNSWYRGVHRKVWLG